MKTIENIKTFENDIKNLNNILLNTNGARAKEKIETRLKQLNCDQDISVMKFLEENDKTYISISKENNDLLVNNTIEFVVTKEEWGFFKSHAKTLRGNVHNNGFFYAHTIKTGFEFFAGLYPKKHSVFVNYLGETEMKLVSKTFGYWGTRVPQKYIGSIDSSGKIEMKTTESYWENQGGIHVTNIIGDFFSGDSEKRKKFIENKDKIESMIFDFRQNLN